jgi:prepilin-type N-terminal cleavage/methylation domain-containing protein
MVNKKGYTLIELIVVLCILSVALSIIFSFFISNVRQNNRINNLNELHYQAQIVKDHFYHRISQSEYFSYFPNEDKFIVMIFNKAKGTYDKYEIKLKSNGDLIENYNEMATYIDKMHFEKDIENNCVSYHMVFKKNNEIFEIKNTVYRRNAVN